MKTWEKAGDYFAHRLQTTLPDSIPQAVFVTKVDNEYRNLSAKDFDWAISVAHADSSGTNRYSVHSNPSRVELEIVGLVPGIRSSF